MKLTEEKSKRRKNRIPSLKREGKTFHLSPSRYLDSLDSLMNLFSCCLLLYEEEEAAKVWEGLKWAGHIFSARSEYLSNEQHNRTELNSEAMENLFISTAISPFSLLPSKFKYTSFSFEVCLISVPFSPFLPTLGTLTISNQHSS